VVVVAARREEGRLGAHVHHDLEAQHVAVEGGGTIEVRDLQVRVTDANFWVDGFAHDDVLLTITFHAT
jgi:mannose-6-phosphate isomerase-like protein (cupin superfamily)